MALLQTTPSGTGGGPDEVDVAVRPGLLGLPDTERVALVVILADLVEVRVPVRVTELLPERVGVLLAV